MATRFLYHSLAVGGRSLLSAGTRSYATASSVVFQNRPYIFLLRPLVAAASGGFNFRRISPSVSVRGFATRPTSSSLNDPNPNWSNRPPKETILLDGCDFEHWLVVMEKPEGDPTRDEIIDSYIKTLAMAVGSEEEARMKIYSVSTRHYFAFGALVSEELSYKLKELPNVRWVLPDSYLDVKNKDYGGEPFINGQAVPYDPKYHEEWVRNNARANERNRRNDRPRQFDRSRNFERRREQQMGNQNYGGNFGVNNNNIPGQPNAANAPNPGSPHPNFGGQPNYSPNMPPPPNGPNPGSVQPNFGGQPSYNNMPPPPNAPTLSPGQPNMGEQPSYVPNTPLPPNAPYPGQAQTNIGGGYPNYGGGYPPNNPGYPRGPPNNAGGGGPRYPTGPGGFAQRPGPNQGQYQNPNVGPNANSFTQPPGSGPGQAYNAPNMAQNPYQGYAPNGPGNQPHDQNAPRPPAQNIPTRD